MKRKRLELLLNILFWTLSSWLIVSVNSIELQEIEVINGKEVTTINRNTNLVIYFLVGQFFYCSIFYYILHLTVKFGKRSDFKAYLLSTTGVVVLNVLSYYLLIRFVILAQPIRIPFISFGILIFYVLAAVCYGFIKSWNKSEREIKEMELSKNRTELDLLKSQLQPHFLFNTLNNLLSMVDQKNNPKLAHSIDKLSGLLRYVVYDTKLAKVPIREEIAFIQNFIDLCLLRFEKDEVDFSFSIRGNFDNQPIEPGILLCYVENAFKHGVQPETHSFIHISLDLSKLNEIVFKIENSIPIFRNKDELKNGGFGNTANLNRLELSYQNNFTLLIQEKNTYLLTLRINTSESNNS